MMQRANPESIESKPEQTAAIPVSIMLQPLSQASQTPQASIATPMTLSEKNYEENYK